MWKLDFSLFPLPRRLFYSSLLLLSLLYPGHNYFQTMIVKPGPVRTYAVPTPSLTPYPVSDGTPLTLSSPAIVQDVLSKVIIYSKDPDSVLMPASTTKIMTALVAFDHYQLDEILTIRTEDRAIGSTMELIRGEQITVENLLYGLLVESGNDAALALAENFCAPNGATGEVGSCGYDAFVKAMNEKAKLLHLNKTIYKNPSGVESFGHVTTARDLSVLAAYAVENPIINKIMQVKNVTVTDVTGTVSHYLENTNELLGVLPGVKGLKTGWTENAGECLVTYVERDGHPVITVVLGSSDRFGETTRLVNWVYAHHTWQLPELEL